MLLWNDGYRTWSENSLLSWLWYRNHIDWLLIGYWNHVTRNLAVENTHPRLVLWYPTKLNRKHFSEKRYLILRTSLQLIIVPPSGLSIGPWQVLKTDPAIIVSNYHPALEISIDQHFIELRKARRMLCNCTVYLKSCDEISPYLYRGLSNSCESEGLLEATRRQLSHLLRQQHLHNFKVISAMSLIIIYYRFFTSLLF